MLGLDAQISIISYAVVSTKYKEKNSIYNSFLPLIEHVLIACSDNKISKKDLISLFKEIYGYDIPAAILDTFLRKLKAQGKIEFLAGESVEIHGEELIDYDSKYELDIRTLTSDFTIFLKKQGKVIDKGDVITVFLDFLFYNAVDFNSFINYNSDFDQTDDSSKDYSSYIVNFLLDERKNDTHNYKFLKDIYYGIILSSLLLSEKSSDEKSNSLSIENVLLDSNYIFRLLDLQTEFEYVASVETFELLKSLDCNFYVLPITIKQISDTLNNAIEEASTTVNNVLRFYGDEKFSGLNSACIRRNLSSSDFVAIIYSLEDTLKKKYNIVCLPEEEMEQLHYDNDDYSSLSVKKPDTSDFGIIHDLYLIDYIRKHRSNYLYTMDNAKWWVLTDDNKLTQWNTERKKGTGVQECITESQLATIFWLERNDFSTDSLFNTVLALRNRDAISNEEFKLISATIERQAKKYLENPEENKRLPLLFTDNLIGLHEMASDDVELVDAKFQEALQKEESIINENKRLEETQKILVSEKEELDQYYTDAIAERERRIIEKESLLDRETLGHINTLKKLREEKETKHQILIGRSKKNEKVSDLIRKGCGYVIFVPLILVIGFLFFYYRLDFTKVKVFYNNNQFLFWVIGVIVTLNIVGGCIKKLRLFIGEKIYIRCFKGFQNKAKSTNDDIEICKEEIAKIQTQIELRMN